VRWNVFKSSETAREGGTKKGEGGSERKAEGNGGILYSCDFSSGFSAFTVTWLERVSILLHAFFIRYENSFTARLSSKKFVIKLPLKIPPYLKHLLHNLQNFVNVFDLSGFLAPLCRLSPLDFILIYKVVYLFIYLFICLFVYRVFIVYLVV